MPPPYPNKVQQAEVKKHGAILIISPGVWIWNKRKFAGLDTFVNLFGTISNNALKLAFIQAPLSTICLTSSLSPKTRTNGWKWKSP